MRAKHEAQQGYYTTIATKIAIADKKKLATIAEAFGLSFYELLQSLLLAIVRYFDTESHITYENNTMLNAFGNILFSLDGSFSPLLLSGHDRQRVNKAILLVERPNKARPQLLEVCKHDGGELMETYNYDTMLTDFLNACDTQVLEALQSQKEKLGFFSLMHTLHETILQRTDKPETQMSKEIGEMFADCRTTTGEMVDNEVYYKRVYNRGKDYTAPTPHKTKHKVELR